MKIVGCACIVGLLFGCVGIFAQGAYLEKGENGFGTEIRAVWMSDEFQGVGVAAGYSIAGILDIGLRTDYSLGEISGSDSTELSLGFDYNVSVVKQSAGVPLSVQILGSYALTNVTSDYLDTNDLVRRATGYTIGVCLGRNFRLASFLLLRLTGLLDYESTNYTDTQVVLNADDEYVVVVFDQDHVTNLYFGGGLGFLFVFPAGQTLAMQAELRADQDSDLQIRPILAVAFPRK